MVTLDTLKYLVAQKTKDAEALFRGKRHSTCIYIMGYAVEYSLKRKICNTLRFNIGFPESRQELSSYLNSFRVQGAIFIPPFTDIKEIRNHNLNKLLTYSGAEPRIKAAFLDEWNTVSQWNPENRYRVQRFSKDKAEQFVQEAKAIINELL
jgi:hypothetical protein